jgi:acetoin utilization protein AcuB
MVFYIHDQGARVSTPLDQLLMPTNVTATDKAASIRRVKHKIDSADRRSSTEVAAEKYSQEQCSNPTERVSAIYAQDIMSSPVKTCSPAHPINDQWTLLGQSEFHHLPVINTRAQLCGIVSDRDFLRYIAKPHRDQAVGTTRIATIMTSVVISAAQRTEIRTIAEVMCNRGIGAVPIIREDSAIVGIVTRTDILRTLVNQAPLELWA